ncbi:hypothetical protein [Streptomyces sp. MMBL 11-1]|uniref:hypothetical protein n=1 Tax=Streptomyces sp. MMBL 11-1 TaxID=3026420 RepID=UPI00235EDCC3|nr:hypothetical protein [Streptomyces sp. MMBL 11-1]
MGDRQSFKLQQARDKHGRVISARQIGQKPEPFTRPLRCPYCEHEVVAQPEQPRISPKGKPFTRGAHFALAKEKEKGRTAEHLAPCPLRTDHTVHAIARKSQGLAQLRSGGLQLRLVLAPTSDTKAPLLPPAGAPLLAPPAGPVNLKIHSVDPELPPAVTSAARIAQLLALYGNDPEDVEHFTVKHPGLRTPVPWKDFCFGPDPDDLARLYQRLAAETVRHPVAVLGEVTQIRTTDKATSYRIVTEVPTGLPGPLAHTDVYLRVAPHRRLLLEPLTEGARVLALAAPDVAFKLWKPKAGRMAPQVVLWPEAHWQIAHWDVDAAGVPTAPRSPSPLPEPARPRRRPAPARPAAPARSAGTSHRPAPAPASAPPPAAEATPSPDAAPDLPVVPLPPVAPPPPAPVEPPAIPPPLPPRPVSPPTQQKRRSGFLARWRRR